MINFTRKGKASGSKLVERPIDLTGVINVDSSIPESLASTIIEHPDLHPQCSGRVFTFPAQPGLVFIRRALSSDQQRQLCWQSLTEFPSPPAHTNFNRSLGRSLPPGLWKAAQTGLRLAPPEADSPWTTNENNSCNGNSNGNGIASAEASSLSLNLPASQLLEKLRWSSIGLIYDWTRRIYVSDWGFMPLPDHLAQLAVRLVALAEELQGAAPSQITPHITNHYHTNGTSAESPNGNASGNTYAHAHDKNINIDNDDGVEQEQQPLSSSPFIPDAALVNYYHEGDTLGGHIDDAEPDLTKPLVSLSLGRPGIFLVGGTTRDIEPTALLVRSGDVVVLHGEARRCYHGVPRIFSLRKESDGKESKDGEKGRQTKKLGVGSTAPRPPPVYPEIEDIDWGFEGGGKEFDAVAKFMESCRINISIRSTAHPPLSTSAEAMNGRD